MFDPTAGGRKPKEPPLPEGATVVVTEGIRTLYQDPADMGLGTQFPASMAPNPDRVRHNLEGVEMGVVVGKGDDITQLQVLGRYVPGGAAGLKMKSGTAVPLGEMARDGTADAAEPSRPQPATVPEADAWAIAVLAEPPLHGLVSGCLQKAGGGGLHMGLLADTDGHCLAALAPGVAVAMLPTSSPVAAAVRIFDVVGATPLPGTKQVSVVLAERKD